MSARSGRSGKCLLVLGLALVQGACDDSPPVDGPGPEQTACDPLAAAARPISLGDVIAAGRDARGVIYVLDRSDSGTTRVFVSEDGTLVRQRVLGEGEGTLPGVEFHEVEVDADSPFTLYVEIAGGETTITRIEPPERVLPDSGASGEELELVERSEIEELPLENLPGEVTVEYLGTLEDERKVVVLVPTDDWTYDDFRVFLGTEARMLEAETLEVLRQRDGGTTTIEARLAGKSFSLFFPVMLVDGGFEFGPGTFEQDGETLDVDVQHLAEPEALADYAFFCR